MLLQQTPRVSQLAAIAGARLSGTLQEREARTTRVGRTEAGGRNRSSTPVGSAESAS